MKNGLEPYGFGAVLHVKGRHDVIDNFTAQPYPLECTADGVTWTLVIGWQKLGLAFDGDGRITPVIAAPDGLVADGTALRYRIARPTMALSARPAVASSRTS